MVCTGISVGGSGGKVSEDLVVCLEQQRLVKIIRISLIITLSAYLKIDKIGDICGFVCQESAIILQLLNANCRNKRQPLTFNIKS